MEGKELNVEFEQQLKEVMKNSLPEIKDLFKQSIKNIVVNRSSYIVEDFLEKKIKDLFENEEEFKNIIDNMLIEAKPLILEGMKNSIIEVSSKMGSLMLEIATKNLTSYSGQEIIRKLFN